MIDNDIVCDDARIDIVVYVCVCVCLSVCVLSAGERTRLCIHIRRVRINGTALIIQHGVMR